MSGTKGKSGGARAGAGRPAKPIPVINVASNGDPKEFLVAVMLDQSADLRLRLDAARTLMPFIYGKAGETGKKEERINAAKKVSKGKFAPSAPPKLVINNDK